MSLAPGAPTVFDDDGRLRRSGTSGTASAHITTAVIGSGVLSLAWAVAQLGWIAGPIVMFLFSFVTYYTSLLLTDCCRSGDSVTEERTNLGGRSVKVCEWVLRLNLFVSAIGSSTAASTIMMELKKSICFHTSGGHTDPCRALSSIWHMNIVYGIIQIIISQLMSHVSEQTWQTWYSIVSGGMFVTYSGVSIGLSLSKVLANGKFKGSLTGIGGLETVTRVDKFWRVVQAIGVVAFRWSYYSTILIEAQDRVKSEATTMRKATLISVPVITIVYMLCGCLGYAALGDSTPEDLLLSTITGFYWLLVGIANAACVIHLICTYQAYCRPIYALVEELVADRFPAANNFIIRLVWRSTFVVVTTVVSILMLPFFKDVVGLVGALGYWFLAVYFPVESYVTHKKTVKWTRKWVCLRTLSVATLILSLAVAAAYGHAILVHLKTYKPFTA